MIPSQSRNWKKKQRQSVKLDALLVISYRFSFLHVFLPMLSRHFFLLFVCPLSSCLHTVYPTPPCICYTRELRGDRNDVERKRKKKSGLNWTSPAAASIFLAVLDGQSHASLSLLSVFIRVKEEKKERISGDSTSLFFSSSSLSLFFSGMTFSSPYSSSLLTLENKID